MLGTAASIRVLLVDDNPDFLLMWRVLLAGDDRFGHIDEADSGEAALRRLAGSAPPHLVMSDVRMGEVSGFDVLDVVRSRYPDIRVVLTSAVDELRAEALYRGAAAFFAKSTTATDGFADQLWAVVADTLWPGVLPNGRRRPRART